MTGPQGAAGLRSLATLIERLTGAIAELRAPRIDPSRQLDGLSIAEVDAIAERDRAIAAMRALEFEIAPLLDDHDFAALVADLVPSDILPITTDTVIPRAQLAQVTSRPQRGPWTPSRLVVADASHWVLHDFLVGNASQLEAYGSVRADTISNKCLALDVVQTLMDVTIVLEYIGPNPDGAVFRATLLGHATREQTQDAQS